MYTVTSIDQRKKIEQLLNFEDQIIGNIMLRNERHFKVFRKNLTKRQMMATFKQVFAEKISVNQEISRSVLVSVIPPTFVNFLEILTLQRKTNPNEIFVNPNLRSLTMINNHRSMSFTQSGILFKYPNLGTIHFNHPYTDDNYLRKITLNKESNGEWMITINHNIKKKEQHVNAKHK